MQVTITGGTGSLAQFVIAELEGKHDIVLFDRVRPGENRFTYDIRHPYVHGDLTSIDDCKQAVKGSEAIIHLGGIPYPTEQNVGTEEHPLPYDETMRVNCMGTFYLMEAARRAEVKTVVIASSNCVLGHGFRVSGKPFPFKAFPVDETHPLDFEDSYSLSKLVNEETIASFSRAYGMHCYALRPAGIAREQRMIAMANNQKPTEAWSDWLYAYVDIRDMARAFRECLEASPDMPPFEAFYVNAADTTVPEDSRDLVERLRPDLAPLAQHLEGRQQFISTKKAERMFGYRARHSWTDYVGKQA